jgi:hypothetical protein
MKQGRKKIRGKKSLDGAPSTWKRIGGLFILIDYGKSCLMAKTWLMFTDAQH